MKAIVTGGEGFIGKALAKFLRDRGDTVVIVDRKSGMSVYDFFSRVRNYKDADVVFHLAAQTSVFNPDVWAVHADNITSFMGVCDSCEFAGIKLVYASSSTAEPCNMTSMYGISKQFDEHYAACYNPRATGVRLHNVYGPDPRQGTLLWHLLNDEIVRLYNRGRNVRHFTYIDDAVLGLVAAASSNARLVNVANPESTEIYQFAETVRKYKSFGIELISETRDLDRVEQCVNSAIDTLPLQYTSVSEGIRRIFETEGNGTR